VPIPGTRRLEALEENVAAAELHLDERTLRLLEAAIGDGGVMGERLPPGPLARVQP
jgi:aryl-alcohol dehydrogenase-like predicted oxidoreductase